MPSELEVFDISYINIPAPEPGITSITLPIGGQWQPNDWRFVVASGELWKAFSYLDTITTPPTVRHWAPAPPPAGWSAIGNRAIDDGTNSGTATIVLAHKLAAGDTDAEFSIINPAGAHQGVGFPNYYAWLALTTTERAAMLAFTVRGCDPTFTPTCSFPTGTTTSDGGAESTTFASRTLSNLPGFELFVIGYFAGSSDVPAGWTCLWDNGYSFANQARPSIMAKSMGIIGRRYTSSPSGTTVLNFPEGILTGTVQPPFGGDVGVALYQPVLYFKQAQNVTISLTAGAAETYTSGSMTATFGSSVIVPIAPGPAETYTSGQLFDSLTAYAVTNPYPLPGTPVESSVVRWRSVITPGRSGVRVLASLDWGRTWAECTNGGPVPGLRTRDTVTDAVLFKVELWRDDVSVPKPKCYLDPQIRCDSGRNELVALGTFLLKETGIDVGLDAVGNGAAGSGGSGGAGVTSVAGDARGGGRAIRLKATDLSLAIAERAWEEPYFIRPGVPYGLALEDMARNRLPGQEAFDFAATLEVTPLLVYGVNQGSDPWQDMRDLAIAIGWDLYFDPYGRLVGRPVRDPALSSPVWTFNQILGPPVVSIKRTLARAEVFNHIIVEGSATSPGTGKPVVPARAEWKNLDPNHPTFIGGKFGIKPYRVQLPAVTSDEQAQTAADALGILLREGAETVEVLVPPVPFLENGDVVELDLADAKVDGNYLVNGMESPGGSPRGQRLTLHRQSRAA